MRWEAMFKGDYLAAAEFGSREPTFTIADVRLVAMPDEKTGRDKDKGTVFFEEIPRGWVLCKTTAQCLAAMFGPETEGWKGKRVTLRAELVQFGRERVPGIRVKGSPDLAAPVTASVKLPRKKPQEVRLVVTGSEPPPGREPGQD
jgi:hypothetical protein